MGHVWSTVLGLSGLLALAVLMLPAAKRLNFPYTVLLAVVGCILGFLGLIDEPGRYGILSDFLQSLHAFEITSEAVLFIFLPALVFEAALAIDVRRLFEDIGPILLLAVVGLLISTFFVGYSLWAFSNLTLVACLLLGAIVSATDPVAVVAIFKDLGAPKRLAILVEGESLFNDATAIVMFTILAAMMVGTAEADVLAGTVTFIKVFVGGGIVGYLCARIMCLIIARLRDLPLVEVTLTISLAYLSFIVAEHYLHVSGVVAVVTAALVVGSLGRTTISPNTWHILTETWESLGFWANSLIFVLVGIAVPKIMSDVTGHDVLLLAVLLASAFVARALIIWGLLPILEIGALSQKVSHAFKAVMYWGGLRGAVSLALALAVMENPAVDGATKHFVGVLVTGFVLFTLFVNATTIRLVLSMFGLDKLSPTDMAIRDRAMALSLSRIGDSIEATASEQHLLPEIAEEVAGHYRDRVSSVQAHMAVLEGVSDDDWQRIGLATLGAQERKAYLRQFADGFIAPNIARRLLAQIDDILDGLKLRGAEGYRQAVENSFKFDLGFRLALYQQRRLGQTKHLAQRLAGRFEVLLATQSTLNEVIEQGIAMVAPLFGADATARLKEILEERAAASELQLAALRLQYPDYARMLQQRYLGRIALRLEESDYDELLASAVISAEVFDDLEHDVEARIHELDARPQLDLGLEPEKLVAKVPFFTALSEDRIAQIATLLQPRLVVPGEKIVSRGESGDAMFFISTGAVEVALDPDPVQLGSGDFFGEIALVRQMPRTADVEALSFCELLTLYVRDFHTLLDANPDLRATIEEVARQRLQEHSPAG